MIQVFKGWLNQYFSDPEAVLLLVILVASLFLLYTMGAVLAPVIASIVIAYLLQPAVNGLQKLKLPHLSAVAIVYLAFLGLFYLLIFVLGPIVWKQLLAASNELPAMVANARDLLAHLPDKFPQFVSQEQNDAILGSVFNELHNLGKRVLSASLASIPGVIAWLVYLVLVPLMVFFILKDYSKMSSWMLPKDNRLMQKIWHEFDGQIGNYLRGKATEIIFVAVTTYIGFMYFGLKYAMLLSILVGLSALIPYVGAIAVTIPVLVVAYLQFGFEDTFLYVMVFYGILQIIDGNVVVPLIFSEAVNLHPVVIILAILVFGSMWGFWGVVFAIPLATLIKAILNAWPEHRN